MINKNIMNKKETDQVQTKIKNRKAAGRNKILPKVWKARKFLYINIYIYISVRMYIFIHMYMSCI